MHDLALSWLAAFQHGLLRMSSFWADLMSLCMVWDLGTSVPPCCGHSIWVATSTYVMSAAAWGFKDPSLCNVRGQNFVPSQAGVVIAACGHDEGDAPGMTLKQRLRGTLQTYRLWVPVAPKPSHRSLAAYPQGMCRSPAIGFQSPLILRYHPRTQQSSNPRRFILFIGDWGLGRFWEFSISSPKT